MSELGQTRHFDRVPLTSGPPREADNFRGGWHFAFVPKAGFQYHRVHRMPPEGPWRAASWTLCVRSEPLVLQITDVIDADDVACIADRFIASDVRLAQDVGFSEIAFALRNSRDGFTLWVENGAYRPRPVILLNVRCHADELVAALNKYRGRSTHFLLDLVNQHEVAIHLCRAKM